MNGWYVIAAILLVELVAGAGFLVMFFTVSTYFLWSTLVRPQKRRRLMRWWCSERGSLGRSPPRPSTGTAFRSRRLGPF